MSEQELPPSWSTVRIGEITEPIEKVLPAKKPKQEIRYLDISGIDNKTHRVVEAKTYLGECAPSRARQLVRAGDVLFSTVRTYLKNIARVPAEFDGQIASTGFAVLRPSVAILSDYLFAYSLTPMLLEPLAVLQRGSNYPAVRDQDVRAQSIPLPPLAEQKRIVAKIEELFSELEAGEESLRVARRLLGVYRQSLLQQAFAGHLTAQWRTQNTPKLESAESLLAPQRREKPQIARLPDAWAACHLKDFVSIERGRFSVRPRNDPRYYGGEIPFVQIGDLPRDGGTITTYKQTLNKAGLEVSKLFRKGTPLIAIVGATIGNTGILGFDSCCPDSLVALVSSNPLVGQFVELYLRAHKNRIRSDSYSSGGQPNINNAYLERQPIGVPSLPEQQEIVRLLDEQFEVIARNERELDGALRRSEALRQAILHQAFTGRLVPQDPSDEPASALLARLRNERPERSTRDRSRASAPALS